MAKDQSLSVSEAVHKIQLHLLDGIQDEKQLLASVSLISRSDYEDVVTERSISNICGYPLCRNPLPSEPLRKGRYRISLKEHRVYDLLETNMFCSADCLINSRAFASILQEERCSVLNHAKLNEVSSLFVDLNFDDEGLGKNGDLGFSNLRIKENEEIKTEEVSLVGPSNAIEGYVPQRELISTPSPSKNSKNEGAKKLNHSVTWADSKEVYNARNGNLCEVKEMDTLKGDSEICGRAEDGSDDNMFRFVSAEACAMALSKAPEAVAYRDSDASDAVSEAGLVILPCPSEVDKEEPVKDVDMVEPEPEAAAVNWPTKPEIPRSDMFDQEDSWFDAPTEVFSLTLSTFVTMWNALFEWITSSSLAYIYGRDESFQEEYLTVNGREYPQKIVLRDGLSSEIKETLAGCISRALPAIVTDLRLPIPISTLEQGMGRLLDSMSFIEALPGFRMKQWQVIVLLFIDALSVSRIPALTPHMTNGRMLPHKVLDGAQISMEEYEVMKDLIIPLGRAPHFSAQSGA
ncbi:putative RNA polymerase II subunit B1 CTD phosphatase RPAP2 homolog isoform X5 [Durio zibethinus]|uniref:RNA polymerase II subunit B1 CTD phosphatase RPAP2 homolog n=1 Tax=Durio zibethinus TaxID=66656 RepID=A0A6P5XQU7_DURZI|nr:putative RNA polymerase II subunit B1 CTD phosphatase RPAP2 homolog isoform X5 [Durio zibethinus]